VKLIDVTMTRDLQIQRATAAAVAAQADAEDEMMMAVCSGRLAVKDAT